MQARCTASQSAPLGFNHGDAKAKRVKRKTRQSELSAELTSSTQQRDSIEDADDVTELQTAVVLSRQMAQDRSMGK
jgi:hypothetical protein